jgi:hypothetical protein
MSTAPASGGSGDIPAGSATTATRPAPDDLPRVHSIALHAFVFMVAFAIVLSRRPDAVLKAQFYAEDGAIWYPAAYQFGLRCLLMPVAGYLHTLTRLVALLTLLFPFSAAPLVMNLCAIAVQILPVNLFLSSRFSDIPLPTRTLASFLYLAIPNSFEIHANITNVQWHLALLACLLLLARQSCAKGWRVFDGTVLVLTSLSSALAILLVPVGAVLRWKRRNKWSATSLALLIPGAEVQLLLALLSHSRQVAPNGASLTRLVTILGGQVFLSSLLGLQTLRSIPPGNGLFFLEALAALLGLAVLTLALWRAPFELRLFVAFALAVLAAGLANPLGGPPRLFQWEWLSMPGLGNRYYFFPMLAFLAALLWTARSGSSSLWLRCFAVALLLLLPIGIYRDWRYPAFKDLRFHDYAVRFERAPSGTKISIPINPGMAMELTKH